MNNTVKTKREKQLTPIEKANATMKAYAALAGKRRKADDAHKAKLKEVDAQLEALEAELNHFAQNDGAEFFDLKKSLRLDAGTIGWKTTPGRLQYLGLGWCDKNLRDLLVKRDPELLRVDAAAVIKQVATDAPFAASLKEKGIVVVQDDKFFVKPA